MRKLVRESLDYSTNSIEKIAEIACELCRMRDNNLKNIVHAGHYSDNARNDNSYYTDEIETQLGHNLDDLCEEEYLETLSDVEIRDIYNILDDFGYINESLNEDHEPFAWIKDPKNSIDFLERCYKDNNIAMQSADITKYHASGIGDNDRVQELNDRIDQLSQENSWIRNEIKKREHK